MTLVPKFASKKIHNFWPILMKLCQNDYEMIKYYCFNLRPIDQNCGSFYYWYILGTESFFPWQSLDRFTKKWAPLLVSQLKWNKIIFQKMKLIHTSSVLQIENRTFLNNKYLFFQKNGIDASGLSFILQRRCSRC